MDKILSYEQIQGFIGEIRNLQQGFVTNFFWDEQKHSYWVAKGHFLWEKHDSCYILLNQEEHFCNLFYIATSMAVAGKALSVVNPNCDGVIDVVCRNEGKDEVASLQNAGFIPYKHLYRMSHIGILADDNWEKSDNVEYANSEDACLVYNILQKDFDPLCEQLPSLQEVKDYAHRKQLLVIKDSINLCGFLIFELSGKTSWYLRYWYTSPDYRNQKIGASLLKNALLIGKETKRQQLWVISDNENAIMRYEHYGFKKENINDYVMIKRK